MNIVTEDNVQSIKNYYDKYTIIRYVDGATTMIPRRFFRLNWEDHESNEGTLRVGRACHIGIGSSVKVDSDNQGLTMGRFVACGERVRFILNAQHPLTSISTFLFDSMDKALGQGQVMQHGDTIIHNDVWVGDDTLFLGGSVLETGCVVGARSLITSATKTEPYGIYGGTPARLIRFRFSERLREALLRLQWWDQPMWWIKKHRECFAADLSADEAWSLEMLARLQEDRVQPS